MDSMVYRLRMASSSGDMSGYSSSSSSAFSLAIAKATSMSFETLERIFSTMRSNGQISAGKRPPIGDRRLPSSRASLMRDRPSWTHEGAEGALAWHRGWTTGRSFGFQCCFLHTNMRLYLQSPLICSFAIFTSDEAKLPKIQIFNHFWQTNCLEYILRRKI